MNYVFKKIGQPHVVAGARNETPTCDMYLIRHGLAQLNSAQLGQARLGLAWLD